MAAQLSDRGPPRRGRSPGREREIGAGDAQRVAVLTEVRAPDGMRASGQAAAPTLVEKGATVLVVDRQPEVLEGE